MKTFWTWIVVMVAQMYLMPLMGVLAVPLCLVLHWGLKKAAHALLVVKRLWTRAASEFELLLCLLLPVRP